MSGTECEMEWNKTHKVGTDIVADFGFQDKVCECFKVYNSGVSTCLLSSLPLLEDMLLTFRMLFCSLFSVIHVTPYLIFILHYFKNTLTLYN